jgi:hypothetical protein
MTEPNNAPQHAVANLLSKIQYLCCLMILTLWPHVVSARSARVSKEHVGLRIWRCNLNIRNRILNTRNRFRHLYLQRG